MKLLASISYPDNEYWELIIVALKGAFHVKNHRERT
jgi:hypothetical protein